MYARPWEGQVTEVGLGLGGGGGWFGVLEDNLVWKIKENFITGKWEKRNLNCRATCLVHIGSGLIGASAQISWGCAFLHRTFLLISGIGRPPNCHHSSSPMCSQF